jgi:hypothetical protein
MEKLQTWLCQQPANHRVQATVGGGLAPDGRPGSPTAPDAERYAHWEM